MSFPAEEDWRALSQMVSITCCGNGQTAMSIAYKNSDTQGSSAPIALCLELTLFQDGFPS